jgi:internalin A
MPDPFSRRSWWHRPRIRFSLRSLMIFVLLIGGTLGWIVYSARVQRDAVAAIEAAGGSVWYQWQWRNGKPILNGHPPWPEWIVNLVGVDYFGGVVRVSLAQVTEPNHGARIEHFDLGSTS